MRLIGLRGSLFVCLWILMVPALAPCTLAASMMTTANHRLIVVDFCLSFVEHLMHLYIIHQSMCFHRAFTGWSFQRVMMRLMMRLMKMLVYVDLYIITVCKCINLSLTDLKIVSWMVVLALFFLFYSLYVCAGSRKWCCLWWCTSWNTWKSKHSVYPGMPFTDLSYHSGNFCEKTWNSSHNSYESEMSFKVWLNIVLPVTFDILLS